MLQQTIISYLLRPYQSEHTKAEVHQSRMEAGTNFRPGRLPTLTTKSLWWTHLLHIRVAGFDLSSGLRSILNQIRTIHGRCAYWNHKRGVLTGPTGTTPTQMIHHIATICPTRRFHRSLDVIHQINNNVIGWLSTLHIYIEP